MSLLVRGSCVLAVVLCLVHGNNVWAVRAIAPKVDEASAAYPALQVFFNYHWSSVDQANLQDRISVILAIRDSQVLEAADEIVAEVKLTDVSDFATTHVRYIPVLIDRMADNRDIPGFFDVTNDDEGEPLIKPSKVYRLFVNLHRKSTEYDDSTVIGRVTGPYYVATSGETKMERARQQIVMRTFKAFYYKKRGWRHDERHPRDCYAYYMWATGFCTVGAENGKTVLHEIFGNNKTPYHRGKHIAELWQAGPIHADYVRKPGHSFMLLAYDQNQKRVWTMESNYNNTIEVVVRSIYSDWKVGHLLEEHLRPSMFSDDANGEIETAAACDTNP